MAKRELVGAHLYEGEKQLQHCWAGIIQHDMGPGKAQFLGPVREEDCTFTVISGDTAVANPIEIVACEGGFCFRADNAEVQQFYGGLFQCEITGYYNPQTRTGHLAAYYLDEEVADA